MGEGFLRSRQEGRDDVEKKGDGWRTVSQKKVVGSMLRISREAYEEVTKAIRQYESEVNDAPLADKTKHTYLQHSNNFVRWLRGV